MPSTEELKLMSKKELSNVYYVAFKSQPTIEEIAFIQKEGYPKKLYYKALPVIRK